MDVNIKVGDNKVIASGTFVTDKAENILSFAYNNEELFFTFLIKSSENSSLRWYPREDNKGMVIEFFGFQDSLGKTSTEPMLLAKLSNGEDLFLRCVIRDVGKIKTVDYTFYLGVTDGK